MGDQERKITELHADLDATMPGKTKVYLRGNKVIFNNETYDEDLCVDVAQGAAILRNIETEIYGAPSRDWDTTLNERLGR
jgi:hypothetical protein